MENPPPGYRKNVGICLINPSNKMHIFVTSRLDIPDSWQMPQGGVDESEVQGMLPSGNYEKKLELLRLKLSQRFHIG